MTVLTGPSIVHIMIGMPRAKDGLSIQPDGSSTRNTIAAKARCIAIAFIVRTSADLRSAQAFMAQSPASIIGIMILTKTAMTRHTLRIMLSQGKSEPINLSCADQKETATEMPRWFARLIFAIAGAVVLSGCTLHSDRQILWQIVHDRCVPNQVTQGKPDPCISVSLATGVERGYVVLKDRNGIGQYLVMPTTLITGIEDAKLRSPSTPNYFTPAWQAKRLVEERIGTLLAREDVGIAVNSLYGRSQDLLHLHVDCLRDDVRKTLHKLTPKIGRQWTLLPSPLSGHEFYATRIDGDGAIAANPFLRLSEGLHVPPNEMAAWTLVLVGADFPDGKPGFVLLAAKANPLAGYFASGEALQDHDCRIRGTRVQP